MVMDSLGGGDPVGERLVDGVGDVASFRGGDVPPVVGGEAGEEGSELAHVGGNGVARAGGVAVEAHAGLDHRCAEEAHEAAVHGKREGPADGKEVVGQGGARDYGGAADEGFWREWLIGGGGVSAG